MESPFKVEGITERTRNANGRLREWADTKTGEVLVFQELSKLETRLNDPKSYTKLFHDTGDLVRRLSPSGLKIYLYIAMKLKINWDTIFLNPPDVCDWCNFGKTSFHQALNELQANRIIARRLGSHLEYWINPNIFYNGDRLKLFNRNKQIIIKEDRLRTMRSELNNHEKDQSQ